MGCKQNEQTQHWHCSPTISLFFARKRDNTLQIPISHPGSIPHSSTLKCDNFSKLWLNASTFVSYLNINHRQPKGNVALFVCFFNVRKQQIWRGNSCSGIFQRSFSSRKCGYSQPKSIFWWISFDKLKSSHKEKALKEIDTRKLEKELNQFSVSLGCIVQAITKHHFTHIWA